MRLRGIFGEEKHNWMAHAIFMARTAYEAEGLSEDWLAVGEAESRVHEFVHRNTSYNFGHERIPTWWPGEGDREDANVERKQIYAHGPYCLTALGGRPAAFALLSDPVHRHVWGLIVEPMKTYEFVWNCFYPGDNGEFIYEGTGPSLLAAVHRAAEEENKDGSITRDGCADVWAREKGTEDWSRFLIDTHTTLSVEEVREKE